MRKPDPNRRDPGDASRDEHLDWQMDFLRASLERYEQGNEYEALRLAVSIRVLCHQTSRSTSLLGQLGLTAAWPWLDTSHSDSHPGGPSVWGPLVHASWFTPDGTSLGSRWVAPADSVIPSRCRVVDFPTWWEEPVIHDSTGAFSRKDLVGFVANQDGGAHVDPKLDANYHRISREWSMGAPGRAIDPMRVVRTPVWEFIRQVAFEVQYTAHRADPSRFGTPTPTAPLPVGYTAYQLAGLSAIVGDPDPARPVT